MNIIDKAIAAIAPVHAVKRMAARNTMKILNSGYGDGGASTSKNSLRGFTAKSLNPTHDIDANLNTLISRSRSLYMTAPIATSAIKTTRTNVVGSGLKLKSRIDYEVLGITEEQSQILEDKIEREFALWAETKQCDALGVNNFYEMTGLFLMGQLLNGDAFCLRKYEQPTPYMPYGLRLQLIESDRVCTPHLNAVVGNSPYISYGKNEENGNDIYSGVELNESGKVVAYWICNQYPNAQSVGEYKPLDWHRVEARGGITGLPNILHMFDAERAEQRRGVPVLAPVIETLKQLSRYTDAELMAAVISGMYTVFIKTEAPTDMPFGEAMPTGYENIEHNENEYELGNGAINVLGTNESIQIADPKRPSGTFNSFVNAMSRQIGSALEIPQELLLKEFNSSYSASRAALLEAWKMFRMRRETVARDFCQPVYEMFLTEAIASGRIQARGFFQDPIIRKAWCGADWNGPAAGMIDPVKEVNAAKMRVECGFATREEETMGLTGGNFSKNARQLKKENQLFAGAMDVLMPKQPEPDPKKPTEKDEDEGEGKDDKDAGGENQ